jgi:DNA-binding NtrC family response regulator
MESTLFTLVADDARLAECVQRHLQKTFGQSAFVCSFDDVRDRLGADANGLLILAAANAGDSEKAGRLVQEISLRKWPPILFLLQTAAAAQGRDFAELDDYIAFRLRWPDEKAAFANMVHPYLGQGRRFPAPENESLVEVIERRLLAMTPSRMGLAEALALAATHDVHVLLTGETGTGKTYLARLLHQCSPRRQHRFLAVSCGALASNLVESEFFGHVRGAFTGADQAKEGKFAAAGAGTLLLDEIDALAPGHQENLLRVLETGEFEPVGSNETHQCRARIIAASNWDLEEAVASGRFRRDLYYRLNVIAFHLPPLREHVEDVAPMARGLIAHYNRKWSKDLYEISPEALAALEAHPWPGNFRELENVLQQAVIFSTGRKLLLSHLPHSVQNYAGTARPCRTGAADSLVGKREQCERTVILNTLEKFGQNRLDTAHALGISRITLYKKMKKYGMIRERARATGV